MNRVERIIFSLVVLALLLTGCSGSLIGGSVSTALPTRQVQAIKTADGGNFQHNATPTDSPTMQVQAVETADGGPFQHNATANLEQVAPTPSPCRDGEIVINQFANQGTLLNRVMVGEESRVTVVHLSWPGNGFGGLVRAIIIAPRQGSAWQLFVRSGAYSISTRAFCGNTQNVVEWVDPAEVESLRRASADSNGHMPSVSEIGIYLLDYEERTLTVIQEAPNGPMPRDVLAFLELTFNENGINANVPLRISYR